MPHVTSNITERNNIYHPRACGESWLRKSKRYERDNFLKLLFLSYLFFWRYQRLREGRDCDVIRPNLATHLCFLMQGKANSSCRIFCRASFGRNGNIYPHNVELYILSKQNKANTAQKITWRQFNYSHDRCLSNGLFCRTFDSGQMSMRRTSVQLI